MTQYNIGMHVKKYHGLDPKQYKIDHGITKTKAQINAEKLANGIERTADTIINSPTYAGTMDDCSNFTREQRDALIKFITPYIRVGARGCFVDCHNRYVARLIKFWGHLSDEGKLTKYEEMLNLADCKCRESYDYYMSMFGDVDYATQQTAAKAERVTGERNPEYRHDGTLSPFSKSFKYYDGEDVRLQTIKHAQEHRPYTTQITYYLNRGMSEIEAERALGKRQTTFSLEICVEKYGYVEGRKIWQARQDAWQDTLNSKSSEERRLINSKKRTRNNFWDGDFTDINNPALLYFVELLDEDTGTKFYKLGATTRTTEKRFLAHPRKYGVRLVKVIAEYHATCGQIAHIETKLHDHYRAKFGIYDLGRSFDGWTECYQLTDEEVEKTKNGILKIGGGK